MLASLLALATVLVSGAVAQLPANSSLLCSFTSTQLVQLLPACARGCQQLAFRSSPVCAYDDLQCHCKNTATISNVIDPCLQTTSNCTRADTAYIYNRLTRPLCTVLNATTAADKAACSSGLNPSCNVCAAVVTVTVTAMATPNAPTTSSMLSVPTPTPVYPIIMFNGTNSSTTASSNMTMFMGAAAHGSAPLNSALMAFIGLAAAVLFL